ncbi:MAG: hypothetical protein MK078_14720 [Crocinitomicaceae bacterium]|nr:hypothetical protein [Crocinitomicaceae bacterium]
MQLEKSINYVMVSCTRKEPTRFEVFDMVNTVGIELTRSNKSGLLLDLSETLKPEEIIEAVKSGLRDRFPMLPHLYLGYSPCGENEEERVDSGFVIKCFSETDMAREWLNSKVN